jgi:hypothetical protein
MERLSAAIYCRTHPMLSPAASYISGVAVMADGAMVSALP